MPKIKTHHDYSLTAERIEFCRSIDLQKLKNQLPVGYYKTIKSYLLKRGFDYPIQYIKECFRNGLKQRCNHYVMQAAQAIQLELDHVDEHKLENPSKSTNNMSEKQQVNELEIKFNHMLIPEDIKGVA